MIAALFVDPRGCYAGLDGVDLWDEKRDARKHAGPWPVVAHPPCNLWINLAALNFKRYGGEHNRPGNDGGCFASALTRVRLCGGVLEHPAFSNAWKHHKLLIPSLFGWTKDPRNPDSKLNEWTCEVWQSAYGHEARKRTWLLYNGENPPFDLNWTHNKGAKQCGWFDRIKPTLGKKAANATPPEFRDALIELARKAKL